MRNKSTANSAASRPPVAGPVSDDALFWSRGARGRRSFSAPARGCLLLRAQLRESAFASSRISEFAVARGSASRPSAELVAFPVAERPHSSRRIASSWVSSRSLAGSRAS